jgi:hypothetical protein
MGSGSGGGGGGAFGVFTAGANALEAPAGLSLVVEEFTSVDVPAWAGTEIPPNRATEAAVFFDRQHFLYFLPLPHGQVSFRPDFMVVAPSAMSVQVEPK